MSLNEEQIQALHEVMSQFRGLQETLPPQLQAIRDTLNAQQQQIDLLNNNNDWTNIKVKLPMQFDGKAGQCGTF